LLTGLTEQEIKAKRKENTSASFGITKTYKTEFDVKLSEKELGELAAKYKGISRIEISFDDGKVFTLPDVFVSDAVERIKTTKCAADVKLLYTEMPDSKFFMPLVVYGYDLRYHIYMENGTDVTADLPKELTQVVLAKVGLKYENTSDTKVAGDDMYVGFRGTPLKASLKSLLEGSTQKVFTIMGAPEPGQANVYLLDMTDMVQNVVKGP